MAKLKTNEPVVQESKQPSAAIHEPTHVEIQKRAYYRYIDRGRMDGFDREDWYLAETELRAEQAVRESDALNRVPELNAPAAVRSQMSDAKTGLVAV
jgi:hypothetical protein